jgi:hypothetical protein
MQIAQEHVNNFSLAVASVFLGYGILRSLVMMIMVVDLTRKPDPEFPLANFDWFGEVGTVLFLLSFGTWGLWPLLVEAVGKFSTF